MRRHARILCAGLLAMVIPAASGCGSDQSPEPDQPPTLPPAGEVTDLIAAANDLLADKDAVHRFRLEVGPKGGDPFNYDAHGRMSLSSGRSFTTGIDPLADLSHGVPDIIGLDGESDDGTIEVAPRPNKPGGCWVYPSLPAGSQVLTVSAEESVRLIGAVIESVAADEIASAEPSQGSWEVSLGRSVATPIDPRELPARIWGARELLKGASPVTIEVSDDGAIQAVEFTIAKYRNWVQGAPPLVQTDIPIIADLRPGGQPLEFERPNCLSIID